MERAAGRVSSSRGLTARLIAHMVLLMRGTDVMVGALNEGEPAIQLTGSYHRHTGNRKNVVTTMSTTKAFRCAQCVRAGLASPPVLAVVGEAHRDPDSGLSDFDPEILGGVPTVLIRSVRRNRREAKIDSSDLIQLALPLDPDGPYALPNIADVGVIETARITATRRLLSRARDRCGTRQWGRCAKR